MLVTAGLVLFEVVLRFAFVCLIVDFVYLV